jgi:hypothetical protein
MSAPALRNVTVAILITKFPSWKVKSDGYFIGINYSSRRQVPTGFPPETRNYYD